jgi:hypothetical protein
MKMKIPLDESTYIALYLHLMYLQFVAFLMCHNRRHHHISSFLVYTYPFVHNEIAPLYILILKLFKLKRKKNNNPPEYMNLGMGKRKNLPHDSCSSEPSSQSMCESHTQ